MSHQIIQSSSFSMTFNRKNLLLLNNLSYSSRPFKLNDLEIFVLLYFARFWMSKKLPKLLPALSNTTRKKNKKKGDILLTSLCPSWRFSLKVFLAIFTLVSAQSEPWWEHKNVGQKILSVFAFLLEKAKTWRAKSVGKKLVSKSDGAMPKVVSLSRRLRRV